MKMNRKPERPERSAVIDVQLPPELFEEVRKLAKAHGKTVDEMAAEIVAFGCECLRNRN